MKTESDAQRYNLFLTYGRKIGLVPAILIDFIFGVLISINMNGQEPSWDFTLGTGIFLTTVVFITFMGITYSGIAWISSLLASSKRVFSDISAVFLGLSIGTVVVIVGNLILTVISYLEIFLFAELLSVFTILLLAHIAQRINKYAHSDVTTEVVNYSTKSSQTELYGAWWAIQATCVGCTIFVLIDTIAGHLLEKYPWMIIEPIGAIIPLGMILSGALPFAVAGGLFLGLMVKKINQKNASAKWKMVTFGTLVGIVAVTAAFLFVGVTCFTYNFVCFNDRHGFFETILSYPQYQLRYILGWIIAGCVGATVGKRLSINNGSE